uniref:Ubiquitin-like domain-containing protein n=1 Tax=Oryza brachyantha TaxID=4533 RepID=J3LJM3_ORYBR
MGGGGRDGDGDAGGEPAAAAPATLHIRCTNGSKFAVRADLGLSIGAFKAIVAENCDVPAPQQRLIYRGRILKDEQTLSSYGVVEGKQSIPSLTDMDVIPNIMEPPSYAGVETDHTIHMVRGAAPPAASAPPAANNVTSATNATTATNSPAAGFGGLLQGLGGAGSANSGGLGSFGCRLPELSQMQQQLAENPT